MKKVYPTHALDTQKRLTVEETVAKLIDHVKHESESGDLEIGDGDYYDTYSEIELAKRIQAGEDF